MNSLFIRIKLILFATAILSVFILPAQLYAERDFGLVASPLRETIVSGDDDKFREQHWIREGYGGGIEEMWYEEDELPEDIKVSLSHRSIVRDRDYEANAEVSKEDFGYVKLDFRQFSKFYANSGGVYYPFRVLNAPEIDQDLELRMGELSVETGLTLPDLPEIVFLYEHRYKQGDKSRLTWGQATEGAVTRYIVPSFQDIEQAVNIFEIRVSDEIKGFELSAKQHWELIDSHLRRQEINLTTGAPGAGSKQRLQDQRPETSLMTTTLEAKRWSLEDKVFTGTAYHYAHLNNDEIEDIFEYNQDGGLQNFASPKRVINAVADNGLDSHTWVQSVMVAPWKNFSSTVKFKSELVERDGQSNYPQDSTVALPPDEIINNTEVSNTDNRIGGLGEAIELRFTGIPHTALYNELEFEQARNSITEDRQSLAGQSNPNANEIFFRDTVTYIYRTVWTIGARVSPWNFLDFTSHFRLHRSLNDYEDNRETAAPTGSTARSAFFDSLRIDMNEFVHRITLKPRKWLRTSFRYQLQTNDYITQVENEGNVETDMTSHIYSFDVTLQPCAKLFVINAFTHQNAWLSTPASSSSTAGIPRFNADVTSWFVTTNYLVTDKITMTGEWEFSLADNFDDYTATGLPLGMDYHDVALSARVRWQITPLVALEPQYNFYIYKADSTSDVGNYNAHLLLLRTIFNWG